MLNDTKEMIERINQLKKKQGKTSKNISEISGIPLGTLNKILSGESKEPTIQSGIKIAHALGVSADYLLFGKEAHERWIESLPQTSTNKFTTLEMKIMEKCSEINEEGQERVVVFLDDLIYSGRYKSPNSTPTEPQPNPEPTEVPLEASSKKRHWAEEMAEEMDVEAETEQYRQRLIEMKKAKERSSVLKSLEKNA